MNISTVDFFSCYTLKRGGGSSMWPCVGVSRRLHVTSTAAKVLMLEIRHVSPACLLLYTVHKFTLNCLSQLLKCFSSCVNSTLLPPPLVCPVIVHPHQSSCPRLIRGSQPSCYHKENNQREVAQDKVFLLDCCHNQVFMMWNCPFNILFAY